MILIIGLGNPEEVYANTRHNLGFMVLDELAQRVGLEFQEDKYMSSLLAKNKSLLLLKPLTYVNKSGEAVQRLMARQEESSENIWVVHDDADLPFGEIKVKHGGSSGGHNGINSIDSTIGQDYWRIRIGIGHPSFEGRNLGGLSDFVLSPFTPAERERLAAVIDRVASHLIQSIEQQKLTPISISINAEEKH
jgi:peptidyl-tRNA hydrolase, PTH1 family